MAWSRIMAKVRLSPSHSALILSTTQKIHAWLVIAIIHLVRLFEQFTSVFVTICNENMIKSERCLSELPIEEANDVLGKATITATVRFKSNQI